MSLQVLVYNVRCARTVIQARRRRSNARAIKRGGRAVVISLLVQAGDERVTLVTYRFKYLLRHLLNDDLQHHEFPLHLRHLRIARRWQYADDDRAVSGHPRRCGDQQTLGEWFVGTAGMGWFYFKPTNGGHG